MNRNIGRQLIDTELANLEKQPYSELLKLMESCCATKAVDGGDGKTYQIQTQVFWDHKKRGDLRVIVAVDDGGWRSYFPMTGSILVPPSN